MSIYPEPPKHKKLEQLIEHYKIPSLFTLLTMSSDKYNRQHTNILECSYLQSENGVIEMCDDCCYYNSVTARDKHIASTIYKCYNVSMWVCRYAMAAEIAFKQLRGA